MARDLMKETERMLEKFGGFYTVADILAHVYAGKMQSWTHEDTWVVTQINEFPRKRVLDVVFVVGDFSVLPIIEMQLVEFCNKNDINLMTAAGRKGFKRDHLPGWQETTTNFMRQL